MQYTCAVQWVSDQVVSHQEDSTAGAVGRRLWRYIRIGVKEAWR